ncbi:DUF1056 family protein [Scopulibacillus darangshiensis]
MPIILRILALFVEDLFVFVGFVFIVKATFMWSETAGIYSIGIVLILVGLLLSRKPSSKRR